MASEEKGLFGALFDFSFSSFVTTKLIKVLYILIIVLSGLGALGVLVNALMMRAGVGVLIALVVAAGGFLLSVLMGRVWLELIIVIFRIAENVGKIADEKGGSGPSGE